MMSNSIRTLALGASIGAGVSGGVFLGFSTFVMKALDKLPASQSIAAMNSINKYAPNPLFMTALFGSAVACVPLVVTGVRHLDVPSSKFLVIGSALYLAGIVVTAAYHIPHNDALALVDPSAPGAAGTWSRFFHGWTGWNHVRTVTSVGAAIAFVTASRVA